jgi:hypothetical protein
MIFRCLTGSALSPPGITKDTDPFFHRGYSPDHKSDVGKTNFKRLEKLYRRSISDNGLCFSDELARRLDHRLQFPFLNALSAGICEVIPGFGSFIAWLITAVLALVFGSAHLDVANWQYALIMVGCSILIQCLQSWLVSPLIIRNKMDLHPIAALCGMLLFSALFGFWGMVLAAPVMA